MKKHLLFIGLVAMLLFSARAFAQQTYTMIASVSDLEAGAQYLLVGYDDDGNAFAMSYQKPNNRHAISINEVGGVISATVATDPNSQVDPFEFTLDGAPGNWTIYDPLNEGYLYAAGGGNYLRTQGTLDDKGRWTITEGENGGFVPVSNGGVEQCYMRYNISSTLFGCYKESSNVAAPVYFFKAGGSFQPDPEPTNYPANFVATADDDELEITLTWNDATGGQLPDKYLVVASTGAITVPVDGTPVANSAMAINVNYGEQEVTFENLDGNTTYHFAIFPYTNGGQYIDYKTDGNYPTANATTAEIYVILYEDFNDELGVFSTYDVYGDQTWHQGTYQSVTYANMNGYANGQNNQNEDWLISPALQCDYHDIMLSFCTAMKFDGDPLRVMVSVDYDGQSEPSEYTWTDLTDAFDFSSGNYEWVESGSVNLYPIVGNGTFYVAFVYTSSASASNSWEIDYVSICSSGTESVDENDSVFVKVYPNPVSSRISFNLEHDALVRIFDMTGRMIQSLNCVAGETQYDVESLENGVYFISFRYVNGKKQISKFVKF